MKQACKILIAIALMVNISGYVAAQKVAPPYAIGFRANPDGGGLTAKFFFNENINIEAMLNGSSGSNAYTYRSTAFVALAEYNFLLANPSWRIFVGPGIHFGTQKQYRYLYGEYPDPKQAIFGFDMIGGIEYVFDHVPIGLSLDMKPAINISDGAGAFPNNAFGFSARYYFGSWANKDFRAEPAEAGR